MLRHSKKKTPRLRRFLLRLREGVVPQSETDLIDAELVTYVDSRYARKVAYVVGSVLVATPRSNRRSAEFYGERVRVMIERRVLQVFGNHESGNPGWMRFTEIRRRK